MLTKILAQGAGHPPEHKEGDVYKELTVYGKTFILRYGYYEDFERESPFNEPIPIYPDFINKPLYTEEGLPFVTAMQSVCEHYKGKNDEDSCCSDCIFFQKSEELFGLCVCPANAELKRKGVDEKNEWNTPA